MNNACDSISTVMLHVIFQTFWDATYVNVKSKRLNSLGCNNI